MDLLGERVSIGLFFLLFGCSAGEAETAGECKNAVIHGMRGKNMNHTLVIGKGELYGSVAESVTFQNKKCDVMSYDQYSYDLTNSEDGNTRIDNLLEMEKKFHHYRSVYIISDSINEGFELTAFFSELGTMRIIVMTHDSRHYDLYKKSGAKYVIVSKPEDFIYTRLRHVKER
ncbi:hypothetical protein LIT25_23225 [Bacillus sp. F19]|nr:hypothetical protein LIT25_23225 [Bacillus sp. F19]